MDGSAANNSDHVDCHYTRVTVDVADAIRRNFHLGEGVELLVPGDNVSIRHPPPGYYGMYAFTLYQGVPFPLPAWLLKFLAYVKLPLCQLHPNALKNLFTFHYLLSEAGQPFPPSLRQLLYCFQLTRTEGEWFTLQRRPGISQMFPKNKADIDDWKDWFLFIGGPDWRSSEDGVAIPCYSAWCSGAATQSRPDPPTGTKWKFLNVVLGRKDFPAKLHLLLEKVNPGMTCNFLYS